MGKGLIGNSLSYTMSKILSGEVSADDIDKIYCGTCFTEETMSELLSEYQTYWDSAARDRARREVCEKYGVQRLGQLRNEEDYDKAYDELYARGDELRPTVAAEAEQLLHKLWDEGKIIQTRYRVPEGQKVKAKRLPGHEIRYSDGQVLDEVEIEGTGQGRYDEIVCIDGEYFAYHDTLASSLGLGNSGLYNNEIELLANQIRQGSRTNVFPSEDRSFFLQKLFPQYKEAIAQVMSEMNYELSEKDVYDMLQEALRQKGEHTAEEIGEGIADLTQGEVGEALNAITDIGEPQKDPHTLE